MDNGTRQFTIRGIDYEGDRITDGTGRGYIELRRPGGTAPLARIHYHGPDREMDVCTYGEPLPVPTVEWLLMMGREALA